MKHPLLSLTVLSAIVLCAGCVMPQSQKTVTRKLTYCLPTLTPVEPDKQTQEDNGVRITVAPYSYEAKRTTFNLVHTVPTLIVVNNHQPGELQEFPRIDVVPHTLRFKVSIHNRLDRVVRMAGTAVAFQVAGKTVAVDKANYDDFLNGIILPPAGGRF